MTIVSRPTKYQAGQVYGSFMDSEEKVLAENIEAGRVVALSDDALKVRKFTNNIATVTFSADLVTSNKINLDVTDSSGVLTSIAEVTFTTDHVTTMGLIADAIEAVNSDLTVTVGGGSNRVLTIRMGEGNVLSVANVIVTAGASQATATIANSSDEVVYGVSVKEGYEQDSDGNVYAKSGDPAKIMRKGRIAVYCKGSFTPASTPYVRVTNGSGEELRGTLRLDNTNAVAGTGISFLSSGTDELALVELNLP